MRLYFTRRNFLTTCAAGAFLSARELSAQSPEIPIASLPVAEPPGRSTVALVSGDNRRKNVFDALTAIDDQLRPKLKARKRVLIKVNNVSTANQLASTHVDALRGILDYLAPRFKGPITIGESSAGNTRTGFENFGYLALPKEYKSNPVDLVDFNEEGKSVRQALLDENAHPVAVRLAARLFDPDAFIIGSAMLKTHNYAVASMSVKNMVLGAPLHSLANATERFNYKQSYHAGFHLMHYNMLITAQSLAPHWGAAVIDGYEGMEGNGPASGTPVASRLAIASTDFIAADRVGIECMGWDANWVGYLRYCHQMGLGNYDLTKTDIRGVPIASVQKTYQRHGDLERQLRWMEPLETEDGSWIGPKGIRSDRKPAPPPPPK
jgi:uncharacterized protein (DUF362 family)